MWYFDKLRLRRGSDRGYAQVDLRLCWSHLPHCWKSHFIAQRLFGEPFFPDSIDAFAVFCLIKTSLNLNNQPRFNFWAKSALFHLSLHI